MEHFIAIVNGFCCKTLLPHQVCARPGYASGNFLLLKVRLHHSNKLFEQFRNHLHKVNSLSANFTKWSNHIYVLISIVKKNDIKKLRDMKMKNGRHVYRSRKRGSAISMNIFTAEKPSNFNRFSYFNTVFFAK